jgi:hypothetical protein
MPTLGERIIAHFARPENAEQLKQFGAALGARTLMESVDLVAGVTAMVSAISQRAEENFPSKAYGEYLKDHGVDPDWARSAGSFLSALERGERTRAVNS